MRNQITPAYCNSQLDQAITNGHYLTRNFIAILNCLKITSRGFYMTVEQIDFYLIRTNNPDREKNYNNSR